MSASSWLVTCGIMHPVAVQVGAADLLDARQVLALDRAELGEVDLAARAAGPGSRRRRPRPRPAPSPVCAAVCTAPAITPLTKPCTSSCVMRPFGPLPLTSASGTPSSRANLRTDGEACGSAPCGGGRLVRPARAAGGTRRQPQRRRRGAAAARGRGARRSRRRGRGSAAGRLPAPRSACPSTTLSPTLTLSSFTHAGVRRRDLHRRLVALDRDQALLDLDGVAGLDQAPRSPRLRRSRRCRARRRRPGRWPSAHGSGRGQRRDRCSCSGCRSRRGCRLPAPAAAPRRLPRASAPASLR